MNKEMFTPAKAKAVLDTANTLNRKLNETYARFLAEQMRNGEFDENVCGPLRFYDTGALADGQHRLAALVKAGISMSFWVQRGLSKEQGLLLDIGRNRSSADRLTIRGVKAANVVASIARAMYTRGEMTGANRMKVEDFAFEHLATISKYIAMYNLGWRALGSAACANSADEYGEEAADQMRERIISRVRFDGDPLVKFDDVCFNAMQVGAQARGEVYLRLVTCLRAAYEGKQIKIARPGQDWLAKTQQKDKANA